MKEKLQEILRIKADIKAALISHGIEPGDDFSNYPELIKSLKS